MKSHVFIGISGWRYAPWRDGKFYPKKLPQKRELEYASRQVNSIEINGSFYSLQKPDSYQSWYDATPHGFIFAVKGPRFITHIKRLRDSDEAVANFFASGVLHLKEKLGPILWQLPPSCKYHPETVEDFLRKLPKTNREAARKARLHDGKVKEVSWPHRDAVRPLRHAMEVRHPSFKGEEFVNQLRRHNVALVVADTAGKWPLMEDVTSDFIYIRLHGDVELYASGYTPQALALWTRKVRAWRRGLSPRHSVLHAAKLVGKPHPKDVFIYFDNDIKVRAPFDARSLSKLLGQQSGTAG